MTLQPLHSAGSPRTASSDFGYPALLVFGLALVTYILTMPRTITLEDAGLFQMVCHLDGLAHPPGYPLFSLFCKPFVAVAGQVIPNPVITGNLISALFAACAASVFYACCRLLGNDVRLAILASLAWAFSPVFWSQAVIIEVYSLAALLFMGCLYSVMKLRTSQRIAWWYAACLLFGLSLANHWPLAVLCSPALLCLAWPNLTLIVDWLRSPRTWYLSGLWFLVGLSPYVSLLLESETAISVTGGINGFSEFVAYVTRAHYNQEFNAGPEDSLAFTAWLAKMTLHQATLTGLPFMLLGLAAQFRRFGHSTGWGMILLWLGSTVVLAPLTGFQFNASGKAFFMPYTLVAMAAPALWFATGVTTFLEALAARLTAFKGLAENLIAAILLASIPVQLYPAQDRSETRLADSFARSVLYSLPAHAVLFVSGDSQIGPLGYLHHVEGVRDDIELHSWENTVFANRLGSPFLPESERDQLVADYISETRRPVFSIPRWFAPHTDYGAYIQAAAQPNTIYLPGLGQWLDYALTLYEKDLVREAHSQRFLFQRLGDFSSMLVPRGDNSTETVPPEWMALRARLLQTFPGQLSLLEALYADTGNTGRIPMMAALIARAEERMPDAADQGALGRFFFLAGQVSLMNTGDRDSAIQYFNSSIDAYPQADNDSICPLIRLLQETGRVDQQARGLKLARQYPGRCVAGAGNPGNPPNQ